MKPEWADFDKLTFDLSDVLEHEHNPIKARILMRALAYIFWQKTIIEELKAERATLEATLRDR